MRYTVVWKPQAERRLAELWMEADDPERLADAANLIERELAIAPTAVGEQRTWPYSRRCGASSRNAFSRECRRSPSARAGGLVSLIERDRYTFPSTSSKNGMSGCFFGGATR